MKNNSSLPKDTLLIYTDGACSGNPGPGGWGCVILTPDLLVTELGGKQSSTTNNRMEITAALSALCFIENQPNNVLLFTDSTYVIRGMTQWIFAWKKNNWQTSENKSVANHDLWQQIAEVVLQRKKKYSTDIEWRYVRAHVGTAGNERCDHIAVSMCHNRSYSFYQGPLDNYDLDLLSLPDFEPLPTMHKHSSPKKAYSYLTYINGVVSRYSSWTECEKHVKGKPGALFKKAQTAQDEIEIIKKWGLNPQKTPIFES
ncbi:MAG: ribonuclease HI [Bdellovibrionales bacterium]|nr:ribonuclease HI [Bdellovibrionales bacterium]